MQNRGYIFQKIENSFDKSIKYNEEFSIKDNIKKSNSKDKDFIKIFKGIKELCDLDKNQANFLFFLLL